MSSRQAFHLDDLSPVEIDPASLICPPLVMTSWPNDAKEGFYWLAKGELDLPEAPKACAWALLADRHYILFVNEAEVLSHANFHNGDELLLAQRWTSEGQGPWKAGHNEVLILLRSDPYMDKNLRPFHPTLSLECVLSVGTSSMRFSSGPTWETARLDSWRKLRAKATTTHYETLELPEASRSLCGFIPEPESWSPASKCPHPLPQVRLWSEFPKSLLSRKPVRFLSMPSSARPEEKLVFNLEKASGGSKAASCLLEASFESQESQEFEIASSALLRSSFELNGLAIGVQTDSPSRRQMAPYNYMAPCAKGELRAGLNILRIEAARHELGWQELKLTARPMKGFLTSAKWTCDGRHFEPALERTSLGESVSAKLGGKAWEELPGSSELSCAPGENPTLSIVADFAELSTSQVSFEIEASSPGRILLAYGIMERSGALDSQKIGREALDELRVPKGVSRFNTLEPRSFRYLDFIFQGFSGDLKIRGLSAKEAVYLEGKRASFNCGDPLVEKLWKASRRTAQLCCQELYMDNPDRERSQWLDNMAPNAAAGYYLFAETRKPSKVLREIAFFQTPDGQLPGYVPGKWFPRIPLQCHMALYALACHRHFMHGGDLAFGREILPVLKRTLDFWNSKRAKSGLLEDLHTVFVDWGSHFYSYSHSWGGKEMPRTGALTTMNAYCLLALRRVAEIAGFLDETALRKELEARAESLAAAMKEKLYDGERGLFRDGAGLSEAERNISQTANALAASAGILSRESSTATLKKAFGPERPPEIIPANAHFAMQACEALFENDCGDLALDWIRNGFGPMVATGSDTLWETWGPYASICQGTGSAVAFCLSRYVAGIFPLEPGYRTIGFSPQPAGLQRVETCLDTPHGAIRTAWRKADGLLSARLELPAAWKGRRVEAPASVKLEILYV